MQRAKWNPLSVPRLTVPVRPRDVTACARPALTSPCIAWTWMPTPGIWCCDTEALYGHWKHEPPCPVAPHHNDAEWVEGEVRLRTLFVTEPHLEPDVRQRIEEALLRGHLHDTHGVTTRWQRLSSEPSAVSAREKVHAHRLDQS